MPKFLESYGADRHPRAESHIYLSGPMSNFPDYNRPYFMAVEKVLTLQMSILAFRALLGFPLVHPGFWTDCRIINPANFVTASELLSVDEEDKWSYCMRKAIPKLANCNVLVLLPGWSRSEGAKLELEIAEKLGMTIFTFPPDIDPLGHSVDVVVAQGKYPNLDLLELAYALPAPSHDMDDPTDISF
jgi:hypothetical protein